MSDLKIKGNSPRAPQPEPAERKATPTDPRAAALQAKMARAEGLTATKNAAEAERGTDKLVSSGEAMSASAAAPILSDEQINEIKGNPNAGPTLPLPGVSPSSETSDKVAAQVLTKLFNCDADELLTQVELTSRAPTPIKTTKSAQSASAPAPRAAPRSPAPGVGGPTGMAAPSAQLSMRVGGESTTGSARSSSPVNRGGGLDIEYKSDSSNFNFESFLLSFMATFLADQQKARKMQKAFKTRSVNVMAGARNLDMAFTKLQHEMQKLESWRNVFDSARGVVEEVQKGPAKALGGDRKNSEFEANKLEDFVEKHQAKTDGAAPTGDEVTVELVDQDAPDVDTGDHRRKTLTDSELAKLSPEDRKTYQGLMANWQDRVGVAGYEATLHRDRASLADNPDMQAEYDQEIGRTKTMLSEQPFWDKQNPRSFAHMRGTRNAARNEVSKLEQKENGINKKLAKLNTEIEGATDDPARLSKLTADKAGLETELTKIQGQREEVVKTVVIMDREMIAHRTDGVRSPDVEQKARQQMEANLEKDEATLADLNARKDGGETLSKEDTEKLESLEGSIPRDQRRLAVFDQICPPEVAAGEANVSAEANDYEKMLAGDGFHQVKDGTSDLDKERKVEEYMGYLQQGMDKFLIGENSVLVQEASRSTQRAVSSGHKILAEANGKVARARVDANGMIAQLAQLHAMMGR